MTTALFLGRMQPPHVGHLLTIRSLAEKYDKLVVGITECEPSVMTTENVIAILEKLIPGNDISFVRVSGSVEGGTAVIDCQFDVCCSGNPAVLSIMADKGYKTEITERSFDSIYSGTRERRAFVDSAIEQVKSAGEAELTELTRVKTSSLRPIEKINPRHYLGIEKDINESGAMIRPLIVDRVTLAVLDGSHRYAFLLKNGYEYAPVLLCEYDDESVFVGTHLGHRFEFDDRKWISKKHVRAVAISGKLYDARTTRHFFPFRKIDHPAELASLGPSSARSIEHLISDVSSEEEVASNKEYIKELEHEVDVLTKYMDEQTAVMDWLRSQNEFITSELDSS